MHWKFAIRLHPKCSHFFANKGIGNPLLEVDTLPTWLSIDVTLKGEDLKNRWYLKFTSGFKGGIMSKNNLDGPTMLQPTKLQIVLQHEFHS